MNNEPLLIAADKLCKRMRFIHEDSKYRAVWELALVHGHAYTGPNYVDELASLEAEIEKASVTTKETQ